MVINYTLERLINMAKFIITIDQDNIDDIVVEADDPTYDGPESNIEDPEGIYQPF